MENYKIIYEHKITEDNEDGLIVRDSYKEKESFSSEAALTVLLLERQVFLNNNWWREEWDDEQKKLFSINVNCNDVFAWGCADAEELLFEELEDLFEHYEKDPGWGTAIWCIKKRGYLPQKPVFDAIQADGVWDLTKMGIEEGFGWKLSDKKEEE